MPASKTPRIAGLQLRRGIEGARGITAFLAAFHRRCNGRNLPDSSSRNSLPLPMRKSIFLRISRHQQFPRGRNILPRRKNWRRKIESITKGAKEEIYMRRETDTSISSEKIIGKTEQR